MDVTTPNLPSSPAASLPEEEQALKDTMDAIAKIADWQPPAVEISTPSLLHALPTHAYGVSEQGGFFLKGTDGRFYEPGSSLSHGAESIALPFTLHGCLGAAADPMEDPDLS